jgi:hypothetical protein
MIRYRATGESYVAENRFHTTLADRTKALCANIVVFDARHRYRE